MIRDVEFGVGLTRLGVAVRQPPDKATLQVYFEALEGQTVGAEWEAFTRQAVATGRWTWFPKVVELLDALREFRGLPPLDAEAAVAYERVLGAGVYTPEGGTTWSYRAVREACGEAAAEAFLAAGGSAAFERTFGEQKREERFLVAYVAAGRFEPETRLLPAGTEQQPQLPAARPDPSPAEASAILREIQKHAAMERVDMERAGGRE